MFPFVSVEINASEVQSCSFSIFQSLSNLSDFVNNKKSMNTLVKNLFTKMYLYICILNKYLNGINTFILCS